MRNNFKADWTIWVDTIEAGRYEDTNKMFVPPDVYDFRVTEQNDEWKRWGVTEIQKRFKYKKIAAEKEMGMICLMWGLKFSDCKYELQK